MPWYVQLIESESGWGQRVDETLNFRDDASAARRYVSDFNSKNTEPKTPDWYMFAEGPTWRNHEIPNARLMTKANLA